MSFQPLAISQRLLVRKLVQLSRHFFETVKTVATPIIEGLAKVFRSVKSAVTANKDEFAAILPLFKDIYTFITKFLAPVLGTTLKVAFTVLASAVGPLVSAFAKVAGLIGDAYNGLKNFINLVKSNPLVKGISGAIENIFGGGKAPAVQYQAVRLT